MRTLAYDVQVSSLQSGSAALAEGLEIRIVRTTAATETIEGVMGRKRNCTIDDTRTDREENRTAPGKPRTPLTFDTTCLRLRFAGSVGSPNNRVYLANG